MSALRVLSVFPRISNIHGDAGNAQVLAQRARWRGAAAEVIALAPGDAVPPAPHAIVLGAGFDAHAGRTLEALQPYAEVLRKWVAEGIPLLAVGLGWELLATSVEVEPGQVLTGLGVFAGSAAPAERATGDMLIDSAHGPLIGYEYHVRDYVPGAGEQPLGTVLHGIGNATGSGTEGAIAGTAYGTHLRGPVLARNPSFADHLLELAAGRAGIALGEGSEPLRAVDGWQQQVTARTRRDLGV